MNAMLNDGLQSRLVEDWQRGLPLVSRPFEVIAGQLGSDESRVIAELKALAASGAISRVGGVVRPNTLGASTLAAVAAPELRTDEIAALLVREPGVNHVYLRENDLNIWFVVTGPDRAYVANVLGRVAQSTGLHVLDFRLERSYHIDLGFALTDQAEHHQGAVIPTPELKPGFVADPGDQKLVQTLTDGLPLVVAPFAEIARRLGRSERDILTRLSELVAHGVVPRIGIIVRHRALGWRSNAMVVWDVPAGDVDRFGSALARMPGINLCYRRTRHAREWPYNLYCMVHARTRAEALALLDTASKAAGMEGFRRQILFSLCCFKQTGALVSAPKEAA